jgi:hypothetical protein
MDRKKRLDQIEAAKEAIERIVESDSGGDFSGERWKAAITEIGAAEVRLREAGIELVSLGVGDGKTVYAQADDASHGRVVFTWLRGGFDRWRLPIGEIFAIPVEAAEDLFRREKAIAGLFGSGKRAAAEVSGG